MTWYQAAEYCNWLSKQEGLPETQWCYEPNKAGKYAEGMRPAPDFLNRSGYRLPTEAEYEYVCRAGALTSWRHGHSEELLVKYEWHSINSDNRLVPVGRLKPNDFGLFDIHGNAGHWCQDVFKLEPPGQAGKPLDDIQDSSLVLDKVALVTRGGMFSNPPVILRSALRDWFFSACPEAASGIRPVRTWK